MIVWCFVKTLSLETQNSELKNSELGNFPAHVNSKKCCSVTLNFKPYFAVNLSNKKFLSQSNLITLLKNLEILFYLDVAFRLSRTEE
jgi:hypothetical protein